MEVPMLVHEVLFFPVSLMPAESTWFDCYGRTTFCHVDGLRRNEAKHCIRFACEIPAAEGNILALTCDGLGSEGLIAYASRRLPGAHKVLPRGR
jgi:hypothetical protein